jgi:hypothetical protein
MQGTVLCMVVGDKKDLKEPLSRDVQPNKEDCHVMTNSYSPAPFMFSCPSLKASVITTLRLKWSFSMWLFYVSYILGWLLPGIF